MNFDYLFDESKKIKKRDAALEYLHGMIEEYNRPLYEEIKDFNAEDMPDHLSCYVRYEICGSTVYTEKLSGKELFLESIWQSLLDEVEERI